VHPITDPEQIQGMIDYLYKSSKRDYMLFEIGINLGIRTSDFSNQKVGFYREACNNGYIDVTPHKSASSDKRVLISISDDLKELIMQYIKNKEDDAWMFPSRKGDGPITRQHIHRIITEAAQQVGILEPVGCNGIRKTFGYWYYKKTGNIKELMKMFNHSSEDITLRYLGIINDKKEVTIYGKDS